MFTITFLTIFLSGLWLGAPLLIMLALVIVLLGQYVGRRESRSWYDSLYWSFITATTVGYGDIRPVGRVSKLLSVVIALIGVVFTGIIVALAVHSATQALVEHKNISDVRIQIEKVR